MSNQLKKLWEKQICQLLTVEIVFLELAKGLNIILNVFQQWSFHLPVYRRPVKFMLMYNVNKYKKDW